MENKQQPSKFEPIKLDFSYDLNTANFEVDRMQNELIQDYIRIDPRFRRAFNQDKTRVFIEFLKDKARLKEPIPISTMGNVRGGKSYSMISLCFLMNYLQGRIMDIRYICANSYEFLERIQEMDMSDLKNSCFLIDEDKGAIYNSGSVSKKMKLTDVQNIIAKQNISTISICPTKFPNKEAWYGLRIMGREFSQKVNRFMLYNLQEGDRGGIRPTALIYIPIITKLVPEHISKPLVEAYENKKNEWIVKEQRGEGDVLYEIKKKSAQHFCKDSQYATLTKKSEKIVYLSTKLGSEWTKTEISEIYQLIELSRKGINFNE